MRALTTNKLTGIASLLLAVALCFVFQCPTKGQYFIIYSLVGIGLALILSNSASKTTTHFQIKNITIGLAGGVALPFILFFTNPIGSFKADACDLKLRPTSVTVLVHGRAGVQDLILRQKGTVLMDLPGERKRASINENGQAFFENLSVGDSVRLNIDFSEPYKAVYPDRLYTIRPNANIYLEVVLQGIEKVTGLVIYNETPLPGVTVKIDTMTTLTDRTGSFAFRIPESMQKKEYKVWFFKDGFAARSVSAYPETGQLLEIALYKK